MSLAWSTSRALAAGAGDDETAAVPPTVAQLVVLCQIAVALAEMVALDHDIEEALGTGGFRGSTINRSGPTVMTISAWTW